MLGNRQMDRFSAKCRVRITYLVLCGKILANSRGQNRTYVGYYKLPLCRQCRSRSGKEASNNASKMRKLKKLVERPNSRTREKSRLDKITEMFSSRVAIFFSPSLSHPFSVTSSISVLPATTMPFALSLSLSLSPFRSFTLSLHFPPLCLCPRGLVSREFQNETQTLRFSTRRRGTKKTR